MMNAILALAPTWAEAHAPVLLIMVPLMLAPIMAMLPNGRLAWFTAIFAAAAAFVFALIVQALIMTGPTGNISYAIGRWPPPLGIEFRVDALSSLLLLLITFMSLLTAIFSWPTIKAEIRPAKHAMVYCALTLCLVGFAGVAVTGDAFNLFVFLEICSISAYVLVALGERRDRRALPAAFNYLIMGAIGASFYIIGIGFLYAATGTLNMADLASKLPALSDSRAVQAGFAFILIGLALKSAMWPMHFWLPNAYAFAPSAVTVLLAATATKAAIYALARFLFTVFDPEAPFVAMSLDYVLMPLALAAILIASVQATFQTNVRRMLAYSSVAQVGYMLLGLSLATVAGVSAGLFHLTAHALMKGALFMAVAGLVLTYEGTHIKDFSGLGRSAPWTMTGFAIAALSLIGVPLTLGFQTKLQLGRALLEKGYLFGVAAVAIGSMLAILYIGRILVAAFFEPPVNPRKARAEAPLLILVPLWILALANIYFGIDANALYALSQAAGRAALLVGGSS